MFDVFAANALKTPKTVLLPIYRIQPYSSPPICWKPKNHGFPVQILLEQNLLGNENLGPPGTPGRSGGVLAIGRNGTQDIDINDPIET